MNKLTMRRLNMEQAEQIYKQYMVQDFPREELKPFSMIRKADARGEYECLGCYSGDDFCGYAYIVQLGNEYLLDYFAVRSDLRGMGFGSSILQMLRQQYPDAEAFLIESENPDLAADADALAVQQRRMQFYLRSGCLDTGVTACVFGVGYRVLELPFSGAHTPDVICAVYQRLYQSFLSEPRYQRNVTVSRPAPMRVQEKI